MVWVADAIRTLRKWCELSCMTRVAPGIVGCCWGPEACLRSVRVLVSVCVAWLLAVLFFFPWQSFAMDVLGLFERERERAVSRILPNRVAFFF